MKKIFLSLSAIALLAVGTVACSSSDDSGSTPTPPGPGPEPTPEVAENSFIYDGEEYELNGNVYLVQSVDEENISYSNFSYVEGEDAPVYTVTEWMMEAYPTTPQGQQPSHFIRILFDVEAGVNAAGEPVLRSPAQAENVFPYQVITVSNGKLLSNSNYAYGKIDIDFKTFAINGETLTTSYSGLESVNDVLFDFTGNSGFILNNWMEVTPEARMKTAKVQKRKDNLGAIQLNSLKK